VLALTKEGQTGYTGTPPADGGTAPASILIQAENFNEVGGSVTVSGGTVGYIDGGEWMKYNNINIPQSGTYKVEYRVASALTTAQFTLDRNGVGLATISVPNSGGWGTYTTISHNVSLNAGVQNLAIYANSGGFNIDWLQLTKL
jgi:endo-1,3-1,4-beta-glycanase ExoK